MAQQALVIGLGQFGNALARALERDGCEVLAVDVREERVADVAASVSEAICLDAMDESRLAALAPANRDLCICAIGDDNREASIVVTAMMRQMGAQRVIARATDKLHERILSLVGAHEVINPEASYGERLAARLTFRRILDVVPLGEELAITELRIPAAFIGRTLVELHLPKKHGVHVVAIRRVVEGESKVLPPSAHDPLQEGDVLVVISKPQDVMVLAGRT